ncbi:hypothetical protein AM501_28085 [Aneurinibacillus migulanus]|uniref:Uncharacterized protein n=2 Tax=Aneurinibacillus migulanus TaxID=47500 RepID=A0A0D1WAX8_ANEMI|nr:hypothetical protein TS64_27970 [Aneurinibacillus migulanus]KIV55680.1 hypothetical protein TS65_15010 [Aneurinibacillus migulanus]KON95697.1 hypothetical protein AF333_09625 [Aneurinibacillus migulanus]KPD05045.1 hypothetical protein AM501_28085 [Aneurinibacillus migulanus]SDI34581.1 hypothetical protein SAMN04487909_103154 [Aneurinibacillus migulanus]
MQGKNIVLSHTSLSKPRAMQQHQRGRIYEMDKKEWDALYTSHQNWKEFVCDLLDKKEIQDEDTIHRIQMEIQEIDQLLKKIGDEWKC